MTTHIEFPVGDKWICVEDGTGYAPGHPDHVTFAVRKAKVCGRPGTRIAAHFAVRRHRVLELAPRLPEVADRVTPETTWTNSGEVGDIGQPPRVLSGPEDNRTLVERLRGAEPLSFARNAWAKSERLRASMPVVRAAQGQREHCDDETAASLHVLIAGADLQGGLPLQAVVAHAGVDFRPDDGVPKH